MRAVIIEDEPELIDQLKCKLNQWCKQVTILGTANCANTGKELIQTRNPELVFLDIRMPNKDAFAMLEELRDDAYNFLFDIIFISGHDNYGIQAVKCSALDYLLKPVNPTELVIAVNKAIARKAKYKNDIRVDSLIDFIRHTGITGHRIVLNMAGEMRAVNTDEIIRLESSNNYTRFYLMNSKEKLIVSGGLYAFEELLYPYGFIRCHQSHLVNRKQIKSVTRKDGNELLMLDGTSVPVARNSVGMVRAALVKL